VNDQLKIANKLNVAIGKIPGCYFQRIIFVMLMRQAFYFIFCLSLLSCSSPEKEILPAVEKDFCSEIHRNDSLNLDDQLKQISDSIKGRSAVYCIEEGGTSLVARAWLCEYAQKSIDVQYFIFSPDNVGLIACDYLVRAADRGVKVRILVDDIMVEAGGKELLALDAHPDIEIKIYNPGMNVGKNLVEKLGRLKVDFKGANQRMHNKTFTVDEKVVITGGRNVADEYFDYDHEYNFRDRDVLLLGKVVADVQGSFNNFWNSYLSVPVTELIQPGQETQKQETRNPFERLHQYACNPKNFWPQVREQIKEIPKAFESIIRDGGLVFTDSVEFVSDVPGKNHSKDLDGGGITTSKLMELVKSAKKSVDIQSPYLVTTSLGKNLFSDAGKRNIKVRVLTNSLASTDNLDAFSGYQRDRKELLETGIRVFEFRPDAQVRKKIMNGALSKAGADTIGVHKPVFGLHAKTMVIDGYITVIGTFNLDPRSANLNCECITIIRNKSFAERVLKGMEEEFKPENSWETTLKWNPDHFGGTEKFSRMQQRKIVPKDIL
jgi:phosphatidylserine/phosphatidylglycerophosphate/cardiolipin synthase-like enzyme